MPSLQAISLSGKPHTPVVVLLDARRDESYFQHFFAPGQPLTEPLLLPTEAAWRRVPSPMTPLQSPFPDIATVARYALELDPDLFHPEAHYVRGADAKPQGSARVARVGAT